MVNRPPISIVLIALTAFITAAIFCQKMLGGIPHIPDETAYVFQGRIFASFHLFAPSPHVPEAFAVDHIQISSDRWFSIYPPGWPLILAIGWIIHAVCLMNPILLGLSIMGVWSLSIQLYQDARTALVASIVFASSPFVLLMGSGFMAHIPCLCACTWCVALLLSNHKRNWFYAGLLAGFAIMVRPYTAVPLLIVPLLWQRKNLYYAMVGILPMLLMFFAYNWCLFGSPFRSGYPLDPQWRTDGFSYGYLFPNLRWYFHNVNRMLWGLPVPDLLIFIPLLWPKIGNRKDLLLISCVLSLLFAYCYFYYTDIVYSGPRYIFEGMSFLSILAARSLNSVLRGKWIFAASILLVFPLGVRLPQQIQYHSQFYHGQSGELVDKVNQAGVGDDALILLTGDKYILRSFFFENDLPVEKGHRVFAYDTDEQKLIEAYPRKEIWHITVLLDPLSGPNSYVDHWQLKEFDTTKAQRH
ncbi:MAG: hypothetical protein C5B54_07405 [Acidobacteria bacterium]|nr:MAG: hypothetical protein C5B54_07405 [Acidobacteriota bacterium]